MPYKIYEMRGDDYELYLSRNKQTDGNSAE